jgi:hypothetical protein
MNAARNAVRHATHFESIVVPDNKQKQNADYVGILHHCADEHIWSQYSYRQRYDYAEKCSDVCSVPITFNVFCMFIFLKKGKETLRLNI